MVKITIENTKADKNKVVTGDAVLVVVSDGDDAKVVAMGTLTEMPLSTMLITLNNSVKKIIADPEVRKRIYLRVLSAVKQSIEDTDILLDCESDAERATRRLLRAICEAAMEEEEK